MSAIKPSADTLLQLVRLRRSIFSLTKDLTIPPSRIQDLVNQVTLHTPSSFNSQSNRVLVLFGAEHDKLWDITAEILQDMVPRDKWKPTGQKMAMFKGAAGTILFFNDEETIRSLQAQAPSYADRFPAWASQSNAMQQWILWTALEVEGLGANLQHYNPLIDEKVAATWGVPDSWKLNAQLVFGGKVDEPVDKTFVPLEGRVKVVGL
ncbi:nitroreductase family protein [Purpureocillium lilacinum]|uniref:Nitroreductase family protein n=1 Tax=Purpureocillium lilacinum TaxID=33203 RepID=A0A179FK89_PURLI|nr:nitroreductase family protein [Purpureocillium lilacinum]